MSFIRFLLLCGLIGLASACVRTPESGTSAVTPLVVRPASPSVQPATRALAGGRYVPTMPPRACRFDRSTECIEVDVINNTLHLYRQLPGSTPTGVMGYKIIAPNPATIPGGLRRGYLERVDYEPTWCPTENIRRAYNERRRTDQTVPLLPVGCVPSGDPRNAMGDAKYIISGFGAVRIHGTKGYGLGWADEATFGCVRLWNDWDKENGQPDGILELASLHAPVGVEIVFFVP